jgi:hypothetical protein
MFAQSDASGNTLHHVGIIIPYESEDDDHWIALAAHRLAEQFGSAFVSEGVAGWQIDGEAKVSPVMIVHTFTPVLTELDQTILFGIGLQVFWGLHQRRGVAVILDDEIIAL